MIVAGFSTVTITSVIVASIIVGRIGQCWVQELRWT